MNTFTTAVLQARTRLEVHYTTEMADSSQRLRIGIIGAGEGKQWKEHGMEGATGVDICMSVTQIIHLPTLCQLSHLYDITAVCDLSKKVCIYSATAIL